MHINDEVVVEWWSKENGQYRMVSSKGDLKNFFPVDNRRPGNDHFPVNEERVFSNKPVFYKLEYQEPDP